MIIHSGATNGGQGSIRAPLSANVPDLNTVFFGAPSFSALTSVNPAYSILEFNRNDEENKYVLEEIRMRFFQLYNNILYKAKKWKEIQVGRFLGIRPGEASDVRALYTTMMRNSNTYAEYQSVFTNGQSFLVRKINSFMIPFYQMFGKS